MTCIIRTNLNYFLEWTGSVQSEMYNKNRINKYVDIRFIIGSYINIYVLPREEKNIKYY